MAPSPPRLQIAPAGHREVSASCERGSLCARWRIYRRAAEAGRTHEVWASQLLLGPDIPNRLENVLPRRSRAEVANRDLRSFSGRSGDRTLKVHTGASRLARTRHTPGRLFPAVDFRQRRYWRETYSARLSLRLAFHRWTLAVCAAEALRATAADCIGVRQRSRLPALRPRLPFLLPRLRESRHQLQIV